VPCHRANSEFWLECLVRTIGTSCIMLKIAKGPKLNSSAFVLSKGRIVIACFVLFSLFRCRCNVMLKFIRVIA
jgi:hypothetical protein